MDIDDSRAGIEKNLKAKLRLMNQIFDQTRELNDVIDGGDKESLEISVEARGNLLGLYSEKNTETESLLSAMPPEEASRIKELIEENEGFMPRDSGEEELLTLTKRLRSIINKTKELDKIVTARLIR